MKAENSIRMSLVATLQLLQEAMKEDNQTLVMYYRGWANALESVLEE